MLLDFSPLRKHRDFRFIYLAQVISFLGSMMTYVALPYQIYQITHSSLSVGLMGTVELVPLLITGFVGGVFADAMNRKKLMILSEIGMALGSLILVINSLLPQSHLWVLYGVAALTSALYGIHRPALEATTPKLIPAEDIPSVSALMSLKSTLGTILGPTIGGLCISQLGVPFAYLIDFATFGVSIFLVWSVRGVTQETSTSTIQFKSVVEGLRYASSRQELIGTYLVDFVAMVFGMPMALYPAVAESFGGASTAGLFYSAPSVGAMLASLLSGWTKKIRHQGAAIVIAASFWGLAITGFGLSRNLWLAVFLLACAGAADMVSGIFRMNIWNQTVPNRLRGRMAGLEMISYTSGPLLGNTESGLVAAAFGTRVSIVSGGLFCVLGVGLCCLILPKFLKYQIPKEAQTS